MAGIGEDAAWEDFPAPDRQHPLRQILADELHARPPLPMRAPARVLQLAMIGGSDSVPALARAAGMAPPLSAGRHLGIELPDGIRLVRERRTEFVTYILYLPREPGSGSFQPPEMPDYLRTWLRSLDGETIAATDITVLSAAESAPDQTMLEEIFDPNGLVAARVASGHADVWTDFKMRGNAVRMLVREWGLTPAQLGRLILRLLDVDSYRMTALLALPLAQKVSPRVAALEQGLAGLAGRMVDVDGESEQTLLREIAVLAAEVETLAVETPFRFGAGRAYHALVSRRIAELRETRIEGFPMLGEFMERRLSPAMRTCETIAERIEGLSRRATRMANLLRTRVDVALERQNVAQLDAMNRRLRIQLRLQETVEGLSVAAITYYAVGLVGYAAQAVASLGVPVNKELAIGIAIPLVAGVVWLGMRRLRRSLQKDGLH